ncbi:CLUMA_CG010573, isoform A [Clunio marinus]|uniref:CLUMA_CG010573, isoform A n=1 Tax=Clunio marinus TaxID=568069 RepID=A0A1J1IA93_9DIPT|nr:CLUMA_CG010573, isoform A [Clunio marinus]
MLTGQFLFSKTVLGFASSSNLSYFLMRSNLLRKFDVTSFSLLSVPFLRLISNKSILWDEKKR